MAEIVLDAALRRGGQAFTFQGRIPFSGTTAIRGPSGAGKTTLLRLLAGFEAEVSGHVTVAGQVWQAPGQWRPVQDRRVGMVFQESRLFPHMTVAANLDYGAQRRGGGRVDRARIVAALELAPLMARPVPDLSGGEARRVALGRALLSDPALLLLDEPLTGLDPALRRGLRAHFAEAVDAAGVPTLIVTHAPDDIAALADRVLDIADGRITGWGAAPQRVPVRVADGTIRLADGQSVRVPDGAVAHAAGALAVTAPGTMLCLSDPAATSAQAVLRAKVKTRDEDGLVLDVAGTPVRWTDPVPEAAGAAGTPLWIAISDLLLRPESQE